VLIGWGPDIREGVVVTDARICDITPTILYLLNQPIPEDMDGWVVTDLFRETYVWDNPPSAGPPTEIGSSSDRRPLGPAEERIIEDRLRDLGYL
jgi:hypothetical protein